jgi:uncharacterized protein
MTADNMEGLAGCTPESLATELAQSAKRFQFDNAADGLKNTRMFVLSANDGLAPQTDALVKALQREGNTQVRAIHVATDHSWSDHRIFLESTIVEWLAKLK